MMRDSTRMVIAGGRGAVRPPSPRGTGRRGRPARMGFTLIELLVVIVIILLVSAVALPTVLPALNQRQASEAARILQGVLVGARDKAIHDNQPSGIRLLPDPAYPITYYNGQIDPSQILAYNRIVPIGAGPEYSEGMVSIFPHTVYASGVTNYPTGISLLVLESAPFDSQNLPNPPTNWFWNIRVGDKVQINNAGPWYTVVGPASINPANSNSQGNPEWFVNVGLPGSISPLGTPGGVTPNGLEYLLLVNGRDDGQMFGYGYTSTPDGWVDSGFDGVDNDGNGSIDDTPEWENETWLGVAGQGAVSVPYTIRRRPAPIPGAREVSLPTAMVIDATSWNNASPERSRLPIASSGAKLSGFVDILLNPDGTVIPTTIYGTPSSVGMDQAFYHFWLAERQDLATVDLNYVSSPPTLPVTAGIAPVGHFPGNAQIKGQYAVLTLFARTGQIVVNQNPPFLYDPNKGFTNQPGTTTQYNPSNPFVQAEQGVNGGP